MGTKSFVCDVTLITNWQLSILENKSAIIYYATIFDDDYIDAARLLCVCMQIVGYYRSFKFTGTHMQMSLV